MASTFGNASFYYLKWLFPSLFQRIDVSSFQCDVCELTKSHCASYSIILNPTPTYFMIIH